MPNRAETRDFRIQKLTKTCESLACKIANIGTVNS